MSTHHSGGELFPPLDADYSAKEKAKPKKTALPFLILHWRVRIMRHFPFAADYGLEKPPFGRYKPVHLYGSMKAMMQSTGKFGFIIPSNGIYQSKNC